MSQTCCRDCKGKISEHTASLLPFKILEAYLDLVKSDLLLVDEIASNLKSMGLSVSTDAIVLAKKIITTAHEKHVTSGRRPTTVAASALYIACRMEGNRIRQMKVASAFGVSEITIMTYYRFLMGCLGLVFPSDEPRKRRVRLGL
jgi:Transcription factor TFIIB repeat